MTAIAAVITLASMDNPITEPGIRVMEAALAAPPRVVIETRLACLCGGTATAEDTVRRHSGVVNFTEVLCPSCKAEFKDFVRVVCLGCQRLQLLLAPQKMPTGFEFKPRSAAHVTHCHTCQPSSVSAPVLEHLKFCRGRGIPTNVDLDIVQEAERNGLQGAAGADKLRVELQEAFATS